MPCRVAVASSSPIFSSRVLSPIFCKSPRIHGVCNAPPSPTTPTRIKTTTCTSTPKSPFSTRTTTSTCISSPKSPFSLRIQKFPSSPKPSSPSTVTTTATISPTTTTCIASPESSFSLRLSKFPELRTPPKPTSPSAVTETTALSVLIQEKIKNVEEIKGRCSVLKRKRPPRISVPVQVAPLSFVAETPRVVEEEEAVEREEEGYSVYCKRGRRVVMEDRFSASVCHQGDVKQACFGVFDGHGGTMAAEFAAKNLEKNIMAEVSNSSCEENIESAIKNGYLITDAEFLKQGVGSGACCLTALIKKGNLMVSNAGDCRAVMSRGGIAEALTSDHQPSREDERQRIEELGGYVDCCNGCWRIQGSLAVTRGIGDMNLKKWVIAEPETKVLTIQPDCEFLILASDGLWDKVTNQEAVDVVRAMCLGSEKPEPFLACKKLVDLSSRRGSMDDITAMIIQLGRFAS